MAGPARRPRRDTPGIDPRRGRALVGKILASQPGGGWASAEAAAQLLAAYGIPAARSRLVRTPAQAAAAQAGASGALPAGAGSVRRGPRAVGPVQPGPRMSAAQHGDLVPQPEQLHVLGGR